MNWFFFIVMSPRMSGKIFHDFVAVGELRRASVHTERFAEARHPSHTGGTFRKRTALLSSRQMPCACQAKRRSRQRQIRCSKTLPNPALASRTCTWRKAFMQMSPRPPRRIFQGKENYLLSKIAKAGREGSARRPRIAGRDLCRPSSLEVLRRSTHTANDPFQPSGLGRDFKLSIAKNWQSRTDH